MVRIKMCGITNPGDAAAAADAGAAGSFGAGGGRRRTGGSCVCRGALRPGAGVFHQPQSAATGRRGLPPADRLQAAFRLPAAR